MYLISLPPAVLCVLITSKETTAFEERMDGLDASVAVSNCADDTAEESVISEENTSTASSR